MKPSSIIPIVAALRIALSLSAQERPPSTAGHAGLPAGGTPDTYASDVGVLFDAQIQALEEARKALEAGGSQEDRAPLQAAIKEMERSRAALEQARKSPEKLPAALAAEQSAYQALLKATPREHRMSRSRSRGKNGSSAGQPDQQELDQLELTDEAKRYETERQADAAPTSRQRDQAQTVDRLKQLARRQQDVNERLRDLQTALQEARTEPEREEVQRQLKRLRDEERQLLSDVDELRQKLEQSPDAAKQADARQQLDQTHTDAQKAAENLDRQSVSEALAAGSRAEQNLRNLRDNLRRQSSSQFTDQMRQVRHQAHELADHESQIARDLDALNHSDKKTLDDSAQRQALIDQMARQQGVLTNILGRMRAVTERAESTEPLLAKQLYDILRRADQTHTENQLEIGERLLERGFLPQASQAERSARQNIEELRQSVDTAAQSVLGSETESLRYAQKELDDLSRQLAKETAADTNAAGSPPGEGSAKPPGETGSSASPTDAKLAGARSGAGSATSPTEASSPEAAPRPGSAESRAGAGAAGQGQASSGAAAPGSGGDRLRQFAQQLGGAGGAGGLGDNGPITGNNYLDWADRMRDVEQTVDSQDVRNQLATVRERVGVYRRNFRQNGRVPANEELRNKVLAPLAMARDWVGQELSRAQNDRSLVPLDRDPVQEKYSELVRQYYEKLGSPK